VDIDDTKPLCAGSSREAALLDSDKKAKQTTSETAYGSGTTTGGGGVEIPGVSPCSKSNPTDPH
jgi:hypothetical protein